MDEIAKFGFRVGETDRAQAKLGILCAERAANGKLHPDDAEQALKTFQEHRRKGKRDAKAAEGPGRQQVSKLRKFIEVGHRFGQGGVEMLERAADIFYDVYNSRAYEGRVKQEGEYNALLDVARAASNATRVLSDDEIKKIYVGD